MVSAQTGTSGIGNTVTLDGIIYVNTRVTLWYVAYPNGTNGPGVQQSRQPISVLQKYDLNDPYEYGAFLLDDQRGFEENVREQGYEGNPYFLNDTVIDELAIRRLKDATLTPDERREILDAGKPYKYNNTKRLAVVIPKDGKSEIPDIRRITLYEYNYDDKCEKLDFEERVFPGTNKQNPNSPCYGPTGTSGTSGRATADTLEISRLTGSFVDFSDYKKDFKTTFQEIGYRTLQTGPFLPFEPKRFELVSSSRFVDEFEDVLTGPVRFVESISDGPRGTKITTLVGYQIKGRRNKRTGAVITGSAEQVVYSKEISRTAESIYVFKPLQAADSSITALTTKTSGVWRGDGTIYEFYTSSLQTDTEKSYKLNVVSGSCDSNDTMFSIYYGDFDGAGTIKLSDDRRQYGYSKSVYSMFVSLTGNRSINKKLLFTDNSLSQSMYLLQGLTSGITSDLLPPFKLDDDTYISPNVNDINQYIVTSGSDFYYRPGLNATTDLRKLIPLAQSEKIFAIQVNPKLLKNSLDSGNFELVLAQLNGNASPEVDTTSDNVIKLIDSSISQGILLEGDTKDSYRYRSAYVPATDYDIVSGSLQDGVYSPSNPTVYGKIYPGYGLILLDANKLNNELNYGIVTQSNYDGMNPLRLFKSISGSAVTTPVRGTAYPFMLRQTEASILQTIRINVDESEFNYSTNPSYYYSRNRSPLFRYDQTAPFEGKLTPYSLKNREWFYEPVSYITTIGLYDDNFQLVAVGKLSKPMKKSFNESLKFVVNLKY
jgi:hypothetical protein